MCIKYWNNSVIKDYKVKRKCKNFDRRKYLSGRELLNFTMGLINKN